MVSQILLLSQPRTACHLLERMLSKQPNVKYFLHPFVPVRGPQVQLLSDPLKEDVPPEIKDALEKAYKEGFQAWEDAVAEAKSSVSTETRSMKRKTRLTRTAESNPLHAHPPELHERT